MRYRVRELFSTLQGEGARSGRAAVFCRFTGCNLWSGHEDQRASAVCRFCDTDFVGTDGPGGGTFATADALADAAEQVWLLGLGRDSAGAGPVSDDAERGRRYVVCTGGEPLLQLDVQMIDAFHRRDFEVAIETNGTRPVPAGVDWVCVSPKAGADLVAVAGDELKVIVPQDGLDLAALEALAFDHRFVQPMADPRGDEALTAAATQWALEWCRTHPAWRLSLQTHKLLGIP